MANAPPRNPRNQLGSHRPPLLLLSSGAAARTVIPASSSTPRGPALSSLVLASAPSARPSCGRRGCARRGAPLGDGCSRAGRWGRGAAGETRRPVRRAASVGSPPGEGTCAEVAAGGGAWSRQGRRWSQEGRGLGRVAAGGGARPEEHGREAAREWRGGGPWISCRSPGCAEGLLDVACSGREDAVASTLFWGMWSTVFVSGVVAGRGQCPRVLCTASPSTRVSPSSSSRGTRGLSLRRELDASWVDFGCSTPTG